MIALKRWLGWLDHLYRAAGLLAGLCIVGICLLVTAQVLLSATGRLAGPGLAGRTILTIPSYADFAGFLLAAASFLAMAYTLRHGVKDGEGGHVRVALVLDRLPAQLRYGVEILTTALATGLIGFATGFAGGLVHESWTYGDKSNGIVAIPLWIPQMPVVVGLALLTLALAHTLLETALGGPHARDTHQPETGGHV